MEKKLEGRRKVSGAQRRFLKKSGVSMGFSEDMVFKTIGFNNISGMEDCTLYFTTMEFPKFEGEMEMANL